MTNSTTHFFTKVVEGSHLFVPRTQIKYERVKDMLTAYSKYEKNPIEMFNDESDYWFGVPRYHFKNHPALAEEYVDRRTDGAEVRFHFTSEFWPGQDAVIADFIWNKRRGRTGFIFEAPPGFGKTVCLLKMIELVGRTTLVIVPRSNLIKQWIERITDHTDLNPRFIGWADGGKVKWKGKKIVVGLVHTLALDRFGKEFKKNFGCVVCDEVDRSVPPETFAPVIGMFPARYRIGASATLKRQDGLNVIFENHLGECFIKGSNKNRMKPKVVIHEYAESSGYVHARSGKMERRGMLLSRLSGNYDRNCVIARYVDLIYKSGRRVLVLSDRTRQLIALREIVKDQYGIPLSQTGFYVRSLSLSKNKKKTISAKERERVASDCKVIFATYGMFAVGTDIPELAGLVYATPQAQVKQSKGRIERLLEGKKTPVIVDIVDSFYPDAVGWSQNRIRNYTFEELPIRRVG